MTNSRIESPRPSFASSEPQIEGPSLREQVQRNAIDLAVFLDSSRIDFVKVASVIPSTKIGILYTVEIGRKRIDSDGDETTIWHKADSASIHLLGHSLDLMSKKKRKKNKQIIKNLGIIQEVVSNPFTWNQPFNPEISS